MSILGEISKCSFETSILDIIFCQLFSRKNDDTKNLSDGYYKLTIVIKGMLKSIVNKHTGLRNDVNIIIGYNIQDAYIYHD